MVYLEKIEVTEEYIKYYYFVKKGTVKGVLIYFKETRICRIEQFCEDDNKDSYLKNNREHAFIRMMQYVKENNYPETDLVMWG